MPDITFLLPGGESRRIEAAIGTSVMQAAVANNVPGILGECGGSCMCATCHVYVVECGADLGASSETEGEMPDFAAAPRLPESRLGCQITLTGAHEGLVLRVPDAQS